jgi:hypothetical protein
MSWNLDHNNILDNSFQQNSFIHVANMCVDAWKNVVDIIAGTTK